MPDPDAQTDNTVLLSRLSTGLRHLHKALVEFSTHDYEFLHGAVEGPAHLLQLLTTESHFSWLHRLSEMMIDLDQLSDQASLTNVQMKEIREQVETMIGSSGQAETEFNKRYSEALQKSVTVVMAHADVRKILSIFP